MEECGFLTVILKATSKNVIPAKAGIQNPLTSLDSRLRGIDKLIIIRGSLISIIIAGCISLSIELIQVYLPTRNSQLTDVITNTIGAIIGVILFSKYHKKLTCNP